MLSLNIMFFFNASFYRPHQVDFTVEPIGKKLKIEVLEHTFMLDNSHDLPIITDEFSRLLKLEFVRTKQRYNKKEVLIYHRK